MSRKKRLAPIRDLRDPLVQHQQRRDATQDEDGNEEHDEPPGRDAQRGRVERLERQPGADVYEAGAVEEQVEDGREDLVLDLDVEVAVPADGGTYRTRIEQGE